MQINKNPTYYVKLLAVGGVTTVAVGLVLFFARRYNLPGAVQVQSNFTT